MRHVAIGLVLAALAASLAAGAAHSSAGAGCHTRGSLPDARCTPGRALAGVTAKTVCEPGYARRARAVSDTTKLQVFAEYGISGSHHGGAYEVDHLVSLELGGSNDVHNLWPEAASSTTGFAQKDKLEGRLHALVCAGSLSLRAAQHALRADWVAAYRKYVLAD